MKGLLTKISTVKLSGKTGWSLLYGSFFLAMAVVFMVMRALIFGTFSEQDAIAELLKNPQVSEVSEVVGLTKEGKSSKLLKEIASKIGKTSSSHSKKKQVDGRSYVLINSDFAKKKRTYMQLKELLGLKYEIAALLAKIKGLEDKIGYRVDDYVLSAESGDRVQMPIPKPKSNAELSAKELTEKIEKMFNQMEKKLEQKIEVASKKVLKQHGQESVEAKQHRNKLLDLFNQKFKGEKQKPKEVEGEGVGSKKVVKVVKVEQGAEKKGKVAAGSSKKECVCDAEGVVGVGDKFYVFVDGRRYPVGSRVGCCVVEDVSVSDGVVVVVWRTDDGKKVTEKFMF